MTIAMPEGGQQGGTDPKPVDPNKPPPTTQAPGTPPAQMPPSTSAETMAPSTAVPLTVSAFFSVYTKNHNNIK